jgi:hypothetical protein
MIPLPVATPNRSFLAFIGSVFVIPIVYIGDQGICRNWNIPTGILE